MIFNDVIKFMSTVHSDGDNSNVEKGSEIDFVHDD